MSGQPEGLSPWPQLFNPGSPSQTELGAGHPRSLSMFHRLAQGTYPTHTIPKAKTEHGPGQLWALSTAVVLAVAAMGLPLGTNI